MILKGIQEKLKVRSGKKFLKQQLGRPSAKKGDGKGIHSVGCIVDLDQFDDTQVFFELIEELSLRPNGVKIIGYKSQYDENSPYSAPVFSDSDLGWNGKIENGYVVEFLSREYDLLINYFTEENLLLQLLSVQAQGRFRAGFGEVDKKLNDLILNTPIEDFGTFKKELKKYLLILNELK